MQENSTNIVTNSNQQEIPKEQMDSLKELLMTYDTGWSESVRDLMMEEEVCKVRFRNEEGGIMPMQAFYNIGNGITKNKMLRNLFVSCANAHLEKLKKQIS